MGRVGGENKMLGKWGKKRVWTEGHRVEEAKKVKGESLRLKRTKDQKENPRGQIGGKDIKTESGGF